MKLDLAFDSEHRRGDKLDLTLTVNIAEVKLDLSDMLLLDLSLTVSIGVVIC